MTFGELAVGEKFVSAAEDEAAHAYQKKSSSSAYALYGGKDGDLVNSVKSDTEKFGKTAPIIKIEA